MRFIIKSLFILFIFIIINSTNTNAKLKKTWEMDLNKLLRPSEGEINQEYTPIIVDNYLYLGTNRGVVKSIHIDTKRPLYIVILPIKIMSAKYFPPSSIIFYGEHRRTGKYYYCAVDIKNRLLKGVLEQKRPLWKFDDWAIFERDKTFYVFDPKRGRKIYLQQSETGMQFPVFTPDKRDIFLNDENKLVELKIPKYGSGLLFAHYGKGKIVKADKPIIKFKEVASLDEDVIPDNLKRNNLYYHKADGTIGRKNIKKSSPIWEKSFFKSDMQVIGPHVHGNRLFYLVSYPKHRERVANLGKIIALDKKDGKAIWLSPDLYFNNFAPIQFRRSIISGDLENNLLLLNIKTGQTRQKVMIEGIPSKPVIYNNSIYILTTDKLYRYEDHSLWLPFLNWF